MKYTIALAHSFREQLADLVRSLPDFTVVNETSIRTNAKDFSKNEMFSSFDTYLTFFESSADKSNMGFMPRLQESLGLVNAKRYKTNADLALANGGFLLCNKPYILYCEKLTQLYGYYAKNYYKPVGLFMLYFFLKNKNLKKIIFRTKTAQIGAINTFKKYPRIHKLLVEKTTFSYPPVLTDVKSDLMRFKKKEKIFLFVSSSFLLRGGRELVRAFENQPKHFTLHIIAKRTTIDDESFNIIQKNKNIIFHEASYSRPELYKLYSEASCFVFPTYYDAFPMVINEALAFDLPIITSDFFSIPERVNNNVGFLYPCVYPNYNKDFVMTAEPFREGTFLRQLYDDSKAGKLNHVTNYLKKIFKEIEKDPDLLYKKAFATRKHYQKNMSAEMIISKVNMICLEAVKDKK